MKDIQLRWMLKKDIPSVVKMQKSTEGFFTLNKKNFFSMIADRDHFDFGLTDSDSFITYVCESNKQILGYLVYKVSILNFNLSLHSNTMYKLKEFLPMRGEIKDFCVSSNYRRKGIGTFMIQSLIEKFSSIAMFSLKSALTRPFLISATVSERSLGTQLFFKKNNFLAKNISYNIFGEDHDGYNFVYEDTSFSDFLAKEEEVAV